MKDLELFVVRDTSGKLIKPAKDVADKSKGIVKEGFADKVSAKEFRNFLQSQTTEGIPPIEKRGNEKLWSYRVSYGRDHVRTCGAYSED